MYKIKTTVRLREPGEEEKYPKVEGKILILNSPKKEEKESEEEENGED